jgi:hypothetical protein
MMRPGHAPSIPFVAQTSKSAVSRVSKPAVCPIAARHADLEVGDTAGLETCATRQFQIAIENRRTFCNAKVQRQLKRSAAVSGCSNVGGKSVGE